MKKEHNLISEVTSHLDILYQSYFSSKCLLKRFLSITSHFVEEIEVFKIIEAHQPFLGQ